MESAFLRMWDVLRSLIFCSSCIVMLLGIRCIYLSNPFFISSRASITTSIVEAFTPTFFQFPFQGLYIWQFFSYFNWSVLFSGDGHINEQAAFFMSVLDYNVWSVAFILQSVCIGISHKIVILSFSVTVWGSFLFVYIQLFFCNWLLELCSPYSSIFANFWTYLKVVCEMWLQFVLYFL